MLSSCSISLLFLIMTQYSNKSILKALFTAPIFILILLTILFILINHEYSMQSILMVCGFSLLIYIVYCVLVIPMAYVFSILLARRYWLNFFSIMLSSLFMSLIVSAIGHLVFIGSFPTSIYALILAWHLYVIAVFVGFCYWLGLKLFTAADSAKT